MLEHAISGALKFNLEFKAKCSNHGHIRQVLVSKLCRFVGTDHQLDTYFNVARGRLKLREGNIENNLIHYFREDVSGVKKSKFYLYPFDKESNLKEILCSSLGVKVVVDKKREIYRLDNLKIHLDQVKDLGSFVEVEAEGIKGRNEADLRAQCEDLFFEFELSENDFIEQSYSDLTLKKYND